MSTALAKLIGRTPGPVMPTQLLRLWELVHDLGVGLLEYEGRIVGEDHPLVQRTRRLLDNPEAYDGARATYYERELLRLLEPLWEEAKQYLAELEELGLVVRIPIPGLDARTPGSEPGV